MIGGHRDTYRAQVLSLDQRTDGSLTAKVFAMDNGFTKEVSGTCLYVLPEHLLGIPSQVTYLFNLMLYQKYVKKDRNSLAASALDYSKKKSWSPDRWHAGNSLQRDGGEVNNTANLSGSGVFDLEIWLGVVARDHGNLNRSTDQNIFPFIKVGGVRCLQPIVSWITSP